MSLNRCPHMTARCPHYKEIDCDDPSSSQCIHVKNTTHGAQLLISSLIARETALTLDEKQLLNQTQTFIKSVKS